MSDPSKDENNADLPRYALNCWKEYDEAFEPVPPSHPMFGHQFPHPVTNPNEEQVKVNIVHPEHEEVLVVGYEHGYKDGVDAARAQMVSETVRYADGSSASSNRSADGDPLPDHSPDGSPEVSRQVTVGGPVDSTEAKPAEKSE